MRSTDDRRREALISDVARQFQALTTQERAILTVVKPDLYFAVAHLARFEQLEGR